MTPYLLAADGYGWFKHGHRIAKGDTALPGPKSVTAKGALDRLRPLDPELVMGIAAQIIETIDRRDQSVHMGVFTKPTEEDLLSHASAFVEAVNVLSLQQPEEFWDDLAVLASELVVKERDVVRLRVAKKITEARGRVAALSQEERDMLEAAALTFFEDYKEERPDLVVIDCPVCGHDALAAGELTDDGEPVWEHGEREPIGWADDINTVLTAFECKVCRLDLANADEIAAADLPAKVPNDHADPHLLYPPDPEPW